VNIQLDNVSIKLKANVYFDGGVISHTILLSDGTKKTAGLIRAGEYHFNTDAAERMDIIAGTCRVKINGESGVKTCNAGDFFNVPAKSGFDITVDAGLTEYLCSFS
jgi:uncharacterized protein YaiE (UPF0345 family)